MPAAMAVIMPAAMTKDYSDRMHEHYARRNVAVAVLASEYDRENNPARRRRRRIRLRILIAGICVFAALGICYYAVVLEGVPSGVHNSTAWQWGKDGPPLRSPDGSWSLRVRFNDGGAMHSGNHWTWVVARDRWGHQRVVAEGYSSPQVWRGDQPFPARWINNATVDVDFLPERDSWSGVVIKRATR